MEKDGADVESGKGSPSGLSHWRLVLDQAGITPEVQNAHYDGSGTEEDPYVSISHTLRPQPPFPSLILPPGRPMDRSRPSQSHALVRIEEMVSHNDRRHRHARRRICLVGIFLSLIHI